MERADLEARARALIEAEAELFGAKNKGRKRKQAAAADEQVGRPGQPVLPIFLLKCSPALGFVSMPSCIVGCSKDVRLSG